TNSQTLARLFAALDSVEATRDLIGQIRQVESFRVEPSDLRGIDELVGEAHQRLRSLIVAERGG
ncbi:MAG: hypothetical protein JWN44_5383, partial [Myxococcales bacterium]|nr:hypothetical protein [Myxococcales bacterium]